MPLTQEKLKELMSYDPETGLFNWLRPPRGYRKGRELGANSKGYVLIGVDGGRYLAHRLAWLYVHGNFPNCCVDHINGNTKDNRIENLRDVSVQVNSQNRKKAQSNSKSGLLGAAFYKRTGKWQSTIRVNGRHKALGYYDTPEQAHDAYLSAKRQLHAGCTI